MRCICILHFHYVRFSLYGNLKYLQHEFTPWEQEQDLSRSSRKQRLHTSSGRI